MVWSVERKYINEAQAKLSVCFPASYVISMSIGNGGTVSLDNEVWLLCPVWDRSDRTRTKRTSNDIVRETATARGMSWFPPDAVVIAMCNLDRLVLVPPKDEPSTLADEVLIWRFDGGVLEPTGHTIEQLFESRK